jgi:hypothetical protein
MNPFVHFSAKKGLGIGYPCDDGVKVPKPFRNDPVKNGQFIHISGLVMAIPSYTPKMA